MESMVTAELNSMNQNFWTGKNVLITGHTGFKGSWLSLWLNMLGANVSGYALEPLTINDNFVLTGLDNNINHAVGDIRDYNQLQEFFRQVNPEIVFHLAAQPLVRGIIQQPQSYLRYQCRRNRQPARMLPPD